MATEIKITARICKIKLMMPANLLMGFLRFKNFSLSVHKYVAEITCSVYLFFMI